MTKMSEMGTQGLALGPMRGAVLSRRRCVRLQRRSIFSSIRMDKVSIPEQDVVALESIGPDVSGLRVLIVNVFTIARASGEWMLVDCGLPHQDHRIRTWTERQFGKTARPEAILLTHGHSDHTGSVEDLANHWDVPVYAHPLEFPCITGQKSYPPPDPSVGGGLMSLLSKLFPRDPVNLGDRARPLPESGEIPGFPEWRWIHTPGHTVGHVSFFREPDRLLIVGDAITTTKAGVFHGGYSADPGATRPASVHDHGLGPCTRIGRTPCHAAAPNGRRWTRPSHFGT